MKSQTSGNACHTAYENGEELVEIVVLGDDNGKHEHLHRPVLVLEIDVCQTVSLETGLLNHFPSFLEEMTRGETYLLFHYRTHVFPCRLLVDAPRLDFLHSIHQIRIHWLCIFRGRFHFFQLGMRGHARQQYQLVVVVFTAIHLTLLSFRHVFIRIARHGDAVVKMNIAVKGKTPERKIGSLRE